MKFLFLCHNLPEYGTYFRAFPLARQLTARGHSVVLMLVSGDEKYRVRRYDKGGVRIIEGPGFQPLIADREDGWGPLDILLRCVYGLTHRFDVVVGFGHKPNIAIPALLLKYLKRVTFIADWCDLWGEGGIFSVRGLLRAERWGTPLDKVLVKCETFLEKFVVRKADGVTVICSLLEDRCGAMGIPHSNILLLRSGCDIETFRPIDRDTVRTTLGLPHCPILEYMGNYHQEAMLLAQAFEKLAAARDDIRLLIRGPNLAELSDSEALHLPEGCRMLREVAWRLGDRVIWIGRQRYADLPLYLAAADMLLLPMEDTILERGRWPNKICDYLASGRPIAATDVGDAGAFLKEHGCAIVVPPIVEVYCRAITEALDDERLLRRIGATARGIAERELSWHTVAEQFLLFAHRIAGGACRARETGMKIMLSKLFLAGYTILVIAFEGIYLFIAWCALKCGWEPKKRNKTG
jgi:glycosyltransferase involved in cell wall biosynthesis